jgi:hypothetical protein
LLTTAEKDICGIVGRAVGMNKLSTRELSMLHACHLIISMHEVAFSQCLSKADGIVVEKAYTSSIL